MQEKNKKILFLIGAVVSGLLSYYVFNIGMQDENIPLQYLPGLIYGLFLAVYFSITSQKKSFINIQSIVLVIVSTLAFICAFESTIKIATDYSQLETFTLPLFIGGVVGMLILYLGLVGTFTRFEKWLFFSGLLISGLLGQSFTIGVKLQTLLIPAGSFPGGESLILVFPYFFLFVAWQVGMFLFIKKSTLKITSLQTEITNV